MAEIKITFRGEDYVIPETRAFEVGDKIEDFLARRVPGNAPLFEAMEWHERPRYHLLAQCIAIMLASVGKTVSPEEVMQEMMSSVVDLTPQAHVAAVASLVQVLMGGAPAAKGSGSEKQAAS